MRDSLRRLEDAERRLYAHYGIACTSRMVWLEDPALRVRVTETGNGAPLLLVHGSGMVGSTWAPLLRHLAGRRSIMVDLPGFGLSDPYDYSGRSLRRHAVAQLRSLLDALQLARAPIVGTSLGAMWALCLALDEPDHVSAVVALGVPAVALAGIHGDPGFTLLSLPVIGPLAARMPPPTVALTRLGVTPAIGRHASKHTPTEWFEVVHANYHQPAWARAMTSHMRLAMHAGRPRPENFLTDTELRRIHAPVLFIWGDRDHYGPPEIGRRATTLLPHARLETLPAGHAPFLDDPAHCGQLITNHLAPPLAANATVRHGQ